MYASQTLQRLDAPSFDDVQSLNNMRWRWRCDDVSCVRDLVRYMQLPELLAWIVAGRGYDCDSAPDYLTPTLRSLMPDPFHLLDMDNAVDRLVNAVTNNETIGLFGDYDVDGATSTALMIRYFSSIGVNSMYHIPDRQTEGYGPNIKALRQLQQQGAHVVITLDCGAVAYEPLRLAADDGLDVIIIDHHKGGAELPAAVAVVNPNRMDEHSEYGHLAAVGVAFLVLVALNKTLRERGFFVDAPEPDLRILLDLVALGTVCDVVPLTNINRAYVTQGLKQLAMRSNEGLQQLLNQANITQTAITATHAGFIIGPRINAGGRVGEASLGTQLLTGSDSAALHAIATRLSTHNDERRSIERDILAQAMIQAEGQGNHAVIMVASQGWHPGVIGIIASRLKDRFGRPAIVIACDGDTGKASARSVTGVDIGSAIVHAREHDIIIEGGGHSMAGGFSIHTNNISDAHAFFDSHMASGVAHYSDTRALSIDAPATAGMVNGTIAALIERAGPFGAGNPTPTIAICNATIVTIDIVKEIHMRLIITDASKSRVKAMLFSAVGTPLGDALRDQPREQRYHICGTIKHEIWNDRPQTTLIVKDVMLA